MDAARNVGAREPVVEALPSNLTPLRRPMATEASLVPALRRIAEIAELEPNWDGEGADAPAARAVGLAALLVEEVAEGCHMRWGHRCAPLTSAPLNDGGLQIEWQGTTERIEIEIGPVGDIDCLIVGAADAGARYRSMSRASRADVVEATLAVLGG